MCPLSASPPELSDVYKRQVLDRLVTLQFSGDIFNKLTKIRIFKNSIESSFPTSPLIDYLRIYLLANLLIHSFVQWLIHLLAV